MADIQDIKTRTQSLSILCVDDDENSRKELEWLFKILFKKVYIAGNGEEALEIYLENNGAIDIVLTDINMPKMDGFTLSQKIKERNILQYIIVISAKQDVEFSEKSIDIGINDIIIKPIISSKIISVFEKYIKFSDYLNRFKKNDCVHENLECITQKKSELFIDSLTGLYSKTKLDEYLLMNKEYNVVLVNCDNFDRINCKYGYKTGDQILKKIAQWLLNLAKNMEECFVFRMVSDEFVFLISDENKEKVENLCKLIIKQFSENKVMTDIEEFSLSCTIGISYGKGQDILRQAHIAIKESREIGKEKYYFFSNNSCLMQQREKNLKWLTKAKDILNKDAVIPYYQPITNNKNGKIYIYEALARVLEINRIVKPYYFLESAKLFNLMPNVTRSMVKKVFKNFQNDSRYLISINISMEDLLDETFIPYRLKESKKYDIENSKIIFEFSETLTTSNNKKVFERLDELKNKNFQLAIDDFGESHLNIKKLHSIKVDYIKICSSFIENINDDKKSRKLVESVIKLAHSIGAKTIAQSVSSDKIQYEIENLGVDYSQGDFIGKPKEKIVMDL